MKNKLFTLCLLAVLVSFFANAQNKNIGVGLAFGTEIEKPGIGVNGQVFF